MNEFNKEIKEAEQKNSPHPPEHGQWGNMKDLMKGNIKLHKGKGSSSVTPQERLEAYKSQSGFKSYLQEELELSQKSQPELTKGTARQRLEQIQAEPQTINSTGSARERLEQMKEQQPQHSKTNRTRSQSIERS